MPLESLSLLLLAIIFVLCVIYIIFVIFKKNSVRLSQLSYQNRLLKALRSLDMTALSTTEPIPLCQAVVDVVNKELGYFYASVALIDEKTNLVRRVAVTTNPQMAEVLKILPVAYREQTIPLTMKDNLIIKAINEKKSFHTNNMHDIQIGILTPETSRHIQVSLNLKSLFVYPIFVKNKVTGVMSYGTTIGKEKFSSFEFDIMEEFTKDVARVLENAWLYLNLRETSHELQRANEKLRQLDHLKDDFVSVASHELRTPMTAIRSYAWMALHRSDVPLSKTMEKYIARILISTERLINLVNDMLNVSRIESGRIEINPEPVDLLSLAKDIADELYFSKSPEKKVEFVVLEKPIPKVLADPDKLRQIFLNLVGNSLKFTPTGGEIVFDFFTDGKVVETSVSDNGVGMSKEDLSKLFSKFGRLDNSYTAAATSGGTGLGLYISKNLVELMHGKIWADSEGLSKGAKFTVSLPVATAEILKNIESYKVKSKGEVKGLEPVAI